VRVACKRRGSVAEIGCGGEDSRVVTYNTFLHVSVCPAGNI